MTTLSIWLALLIGWMRCRGVLEATGRKITPAPVLIALWAAVALGALLQWLSPSLLDHAARDADAIADGQWWRLVTSMFFQDGGLLGALFNLFILGITLALVGPLLGPLRSVVVFGVCGVAGNLLSIATGWAEWGAGNSMATLGLLATAVAATSLQPPGGVGRWLRLALVVAAGAGLVLQQDHHGPAIGFGLALGLLWLIVAPASGQERSVESTARPS